MSWGLEAGFLLDRQWYWLRGEMERTKKPTLLILGRLFAAERIPYAIIGGVALQVHHPDPRTTLDIDIAVLSRKAVPTETLIEAGFRKTGSFEHSENWVSADGMIVQFTDDSALAGAISSADEVNVDDVTLRVIRAVDLLHEKLRAGSDPERRRSKRFQDLGDAQALLETNPELERELTANERAILKRGVPD
ncbi:MAG TPA: nucleotidyl transferase AbiEii/AbiGii toxin family protein [Thermoanaerobaculia bacterium]|nr:nucleotidyl transferase AbiEii/AbiGii toxin family protein [Thermoanaerobaculia bacterium]